MLWSLIKMSLLMLSYLGYWEFFRKKFNLSIFFLPAFTLAFQFLIMFIPGLLNFLGECVLLIYLTGFLFLLETFRKEGLRFLKAYLNPGYLVFAVMFMAICVAVRGERFGDGDNFHHWGVVVKNMLEANCFPTFAQQTVGFGHYPLGSSALIYYFCRFVGAEEDVMMMAQAFLMLSMFLPVFAYAKNNNVLPVLIATVMLNFILAYNQLITDLLVDTLLGIVACSMMLTWHYECIGKQDQKLLDKYPREYLLFPMLLLTMNVKTSGILFVAIAFLVAFLTLQKQGNNQKSLLKMGVALAVVYFLWSRHCDYVFLGIEGNQHAVSTNYFKEILKEKSLEDVKLIIWRACVYAITRKEGVWLVAMTIGACIVSWGVKTQRKEMLLYVCGMYVAYFIGLVGMFIFSMQREQALRLECVDRYIKTVDILIYMVLTVFVISVLSRMEHKRNAVLIGILAVALTLGVWGNTAEMRTVFQMKQDLTQRLRVEALLEEYGVSEGWSYLVLDKKETAHYSSYVVRYHMNSSDVHYITVADGEQLGDVEEYQYILILDEQNPHIQSWVEEKYPDQAHERVIRCFGKI